LSQANEDFAGIAGLEEGIAFAAPTKRRRNSLIGKRLLKLRKRSALGH
jgi:hypothetical protein